MKRIEYDVLIVGGGIAGLTAAHRLADGAKAAGAPLRIAVLEKAKNIGAHVLSGAVSNPRSVKKLFPDYETNGFPLEGKCAESHMTLLGARRAKDMPFAPPEMNKTGYLILSLSNVCAWMAENLLEKTKDTAVAVDLYNGFAAQEILYDGARVAGVRVDDTGEPEQDTCYAKITIFADKGLLSRDLVEKFKLAQGNQTYAVGVKEIWETEQDFSGKVWHTMGYPLMDGCFGGGFIYGLKDKKLAIGMVAGLDEANPNLQPPQILQALKKHPFVQQMIKGGKLARYGASVIPEAGWSAMPKDLAVDGAMIVGDAASTMDIKGFSGVDKAMESAMCAADAAFAALQKNDTSKAALASYQQALLDGWVGRELKQSRYYRYAFHKNPAIFRDYLPVVTAGIDNGSFISGGINAFLKGPAGLIGGGLSLLSLMNGRGGEDPRFAEDRTCSKPDHKAAPLAEPKGFAKNSVYLTPDMVFYAHTHYHLGNDHIKEFDAAVCKKCIARFEAGNNPPPCVGDCTADVHSVLAKDGVKSHQMALENCVQCRTCEIVCPEKNIRVNPALHGSGPDFRGL